MPLKRGFALVQILIGLAILGIAGSIVMPSFMRQMRRYEQNQSISMFDSMVAQACLQSIQSGKIYHVKVHVPSGTVTIEKQKKTEEGGVIYEKVPLYSSATDFVLPKKYEIVNFYINGVDEFASHGAGRTVDDVFFIIYPRGYTQAVVINILNGEDVTHNSHGSEIGLVLNPFRMQFEVYDAFQKP